MQLNRIINADCMEIMKDIPDKYFELAIVLKSVKIYEVEYNGLIGKENIKRFHPCQKPVKLLKRLLNDYAKAGDKIIDTHSGSGTTAVACIDMGFQYLCVLRKIRITMKQV